MAKSSICVLVTSVGGVGVQIVNALRRSGNPYTIVGADLSPRCLAFSSCEHALTLPHGKSPHYFEALTKVIRHFNVKALFPGNEAELKVLGQHASALEALGVMLPICPPAVLDICLDKQKTAAWLAQNGFSAPRSRQLGDASEVSAIDFFPVIVKPISGGSGSRNTFIAQTPEELAHLARYLAATGEKFLVQEYMGTAEAEFTVGVLHDLDGNYVDAIAMRRYLAGDLHVRCSVPNRSQRKDLGPHLVISSGVSHGEISRYPAVTEPCREIAAKLGARGPINIQCRLVSGVMVPFEINPRFSGTTGLRAMVGYNEPDALVRIHLKKEKVDFAYRSATIIRSLTETILGETLAKPWDSL